MKASTDNVKVGDIFYATFGYEACFVDFFQVIEKKGSMIKIRENQKHHDYDGGVDGNCGYTCYTSAIKDSFCGETLTKRLFGEGFTHRSNHFHKWDGRPIYEYNDH